MDRPPQQRAHFFLNVDDDLGFAQLFGKARVVLLKFLNFLLRRIALGLGAALLRSQRVANAGGALAPPSRQQRRVQPFPAEERSDATGAFRLVGFGQDALFVLGGEATALGLGDDLRVGVGVRFGAGFAASGTPVALAALRSLSLRSGSLRATGSKAAGAGAGTLWLFMCKRIFLALHCNYGTRSVSLMLARRARKKYLNPAEL